MTPWTVVRQAPLSMGSSRQEYWSGLPCLPPGNLPDPGIKLESPAMQADSLPLSHLGSPNSGIPSKIVRFKDKVKFSRSPGKTTVYEEAKELE